MAAALPTVGGEVDMTWTRLDDGWTDRPVFDELPYDVRWHYLCLVQWCSRTSRYDGKIRRADARRCSDLDDPDTALAVLAATELVDVDVDGTVSLPLIVEHVPPPSERDGTRKERARTEKRRSRKHLAGDHSECLPERCFKAPPVVEEVSDESGTGSTSRHGPSCPEPEVSTDVSADCLTESEEWEREWGPDEPSRR